jgi:hypothetical protein
VGGGYFLAHLVAAFESEIDGDFLADAVCIWWGWWGNAGVPGRGERGPVGGWQ